MTNETKPVEINIPLSEVISSYWARKTLSNSGGPVVAGGETACFLRAEITFREKYADRTAHTLIRRIETVKKLRTHIAKYPVLNLDVKNISILKT